MRANGRHAVALAAAAGVVVVAASAAARPVTVDASTAAIGKIAFATRSVGSVDAYRIVVMNPNGRLVRVLPLAPGHSFNPAWSPDDTKIAFVSAGYYGERPEVWVMNANGRGMHRLARRGEEPAWGPDGSSVAFSRADDIYVMSPDGSAKRRLTRYGSSPAWSPDGLQIAFVRKVPQSCYRRRGPRCQSEIFVMRADGTGQRRLTRNRFIDHAPDWSPTGARIAYVRNSQIFVMNADGSGRRRLTRGARGGSDPSWSPDATKIVYDDGAFSIYTMNADGSRKRRIHECSDGCGGPAWSRRG